jgi:hypothetical protein
MRGLTRRITSVTAAAGVGLALALSATAAQAASSGNYWKVSYRSYSNTGDPVSSVTAPAADDAWAVGNTTLADGQNQALILHWNGSAWSKVTVAGASGFSPVVAESSSASNVWIFGFDSSAATALVYDGTSWQSMTVPATSLGVVLSSSDVWGSAGSTCTGTTCTTTLWHWNGTAWASFDVSGEFQDIAEAGGDAYILTLDKLQNLSSGDPTGVPVLYQSSDGSTPQQITAPSRRMYDFAQLTGSPAGQLWLMGQLGSNKNKTALFSSSATGWTQRAVPSKVGANLFILGNPLAYDGQNGFWAGPYAHWTGTKWVNAYNVGHLPGTDTFALLGFTPVPGSGSVWGVGWAGRSPTNSTQDSLIADYGGLP